jgi:uroporphyrinogen decarboxylase
VTTPEVIADLQSWMATVLQPVPTPPGMTSREIVRRAIECDQPPRIPYSFLMPARSDFFELAALEAEVKSRDLHVTSRRAGDIYRDEWGVRQRTTGYSWDQIVDHPLKDLRDLAAYRLPDIAARQRFDWLAPFIQRAREVGKYVVAADPVLMYERLQALMGFEQLMIAPHTLRDALATLLDDLTDLTIGVIEQLARVGGVDAFMTWQDYGSQTGLHMNLRTFRTLYKPRYARIVAAAHEAGMHFIWHTCGRVSDLIGEMVDIGVDVVQLDQPQLLGHREMAERFGGAICFWNTIDIQWATSGAIAPADIRAEVVRMLESFPRFRGGLMVRHYPQPSDIGLSREFHDLSARAFLENGCGLPMS